MITNEGYWLIRVLMFLSAILLGLGVATIANGSIFGIGFVIFAFIPACIGSFLAGLISGHDDREGP